MSRQATSRLKVNPPLGRMPTLQFCRPAELRIDPAYQRDITSGPSQSLIRKIAQHWNWDLCQPLVVARRRDLTERLFVIDGQHRLEAARLRGDIEQLPCVIVEYASAADEAASFVHLNQQRRPLSAIDLFKAAVASEDGEACAIMKAIGEAGLSLAPHLTSAAWKPGMIGNIGGIQRCWRSRGGTVTGEALRVLFEAYAGQVLQYAGTLFPGIAAVCADEMGAGPFVHSRRERFIAMLGRHSQRHWRSEAMRARAEAERLGFVEAFEKVLRAAWAVEPSAPATPAPVAPAVRAEPERRVPKGDRRFREHKPAPFELGYVPTESADRSKPRMRPAPAALTGTKRADGKVWCGPCDYFVPPNFGDGCITNGCPLRKSA